MDGIVVATCEHENLRGRILPALHRAEGYDLRVTLPLEVVLVGAGSRGRDVYGRYALSRPDRLRVVAVAEPDPDRRARLANEHEIPAGRTFGDWKDLVQGPRRAPAAIVATGDDLHTEPALAALRSGYHCLLEKPMAMTLGECEEIVSAAASARRILQVGHVLRYTEFYGTIHRLVAEEDRIGEVQTISMAEHVAHWHFTHSYVRGRWRNTARAAPLILAKCCHDLDLMCWFTGRFPLRVASFGSRVHYRPEAAPPDAAERCTDDCPAESTCPHSAPRFYGRDLQIWPWTDVSPAPTTEARLEALRSGPYGRCVYRTDNDVVDRQSLLIGFQDGVQGTFLVDGFSSRPERTIRIQGTRAELRGLFEKGEIEILHYGRVEPERISTFAEVGHGGGDVGLLDHFTDVASRDALDDVLASGQVALASHRLGFAAEIARREGRVVDLAEL
jgi:predicted dehydrogenase